MAFSNPPCPTNAQKCDYPEQMHPTTTPLQFSFLQKVFDIDFPPFLYGVFEIPLLKKRPKTRH
jgi:hypothetical protein